jgi:hypothetical protein
VEQILKKDMEIKKVAKAIKQRTRKKTEEKNNDGD